MKLFRPTGLAELKLVKESNWFAWPPRLPDQPIFYPVTTHEYAVKIARDWNSSNAAPNNWGFVTQFHISDRAAKRYPVQDAGGVAHRELWVPAEELIWFNSEIEGKIEVVAAFQDRHEIDLVTTLGSLELA